LIKTTQHFIKDQSRQKKAAHVEREMSKVS